jgi:hypothetical protein
VCSEGRENTKTTAVFHLTTKVNSKREKNGSVWGWPESIENFPAMDEESFPG